MKSILLLLVIAMALPLHCPAEKQRVGVILPLSGFAESFGENIRRGIDLAYTDLSATQKEQIQLIFEDSTSSAANSLSAYKKLVLNEKVRYLITAFSPISLPLAPLSESDRIPTIAIASSTKVSEGRKYTVGLFPSADLLAEKLADEAWRRGYRRIARLSTQGEAYLAWKNAFDKAGEGRFEIPLDEECLPEERDFRPFIARMHSERRLDGILAYTAVGQTGLFSRQIRESGLTLPLFGSTNFEDKVELELSNGALVGQWYVSSKIEESFLEKYRRKYPDASLYGASYGYDALGALSHAIASAASPEAANTALHTIKNYKGASGVFSSTADNRYSIPAVVKVVTKDGFQDLY